MKATIEHNVTVTLEMTADELMTLRAALNLANSTVMPDEEAAALESLYLAICYAQDHQQ